MKKITFFKSLLVAVMLLTGASAWAGDVSTIYTKALAGWKSDDVTKTANTEGKWYNSTGIVANDYLTGMMIDATNGLRLCARQTTATTELTLDRDDNTIVTIDAVWNTGNQSYPNNSNCNSFIYGDFKFDFYTRYKTTQYTINGVTKAVTSAAADEEISIHLVVNSVSNKITELLVAKAADPTVIYVQYSDLDATNNTFAVGSNYNTVIIKSVNAVSKNYNYTSLKSITVQQETQDVATASVTFKYVDTVGNDLSVYQADQVLSGVAVGAEISGLISSYTSTFYNGESNKYVYANEFSVVGDYTTVQAGDNTVTLKFTDYPSTAYTVMAQVDGADLVAVATGNAFLDGSTSAPFSKFATKDGKWYQTGNPYHVAINAATVYVPYTLIDNAVYCSEAEDIEGLTTWQHAKYVNDMSNGSSAVFADGGTNITTLSEVGIYTITGCAIGRANDRYIDFYKNSKDDSNKILRVVSKTNGGEGSGSFVVTESTDIIADGGYAGGDSGHACDYIYIQKTGEYYESMTIVGDFSEGGFDDLNKGIEMTRSTENPFEWTAVVKDFTVTSSKYNYNYKAVGNHDYSVYELPSGYNVYQNYNFDYDGAREGKYTLTFTVNTQTHSVEMAIEKQKTATIYFVNTNDWAAENIKAYVWNASGNNGWPGETMTATGEQVDGKDVYSWSTYALDLPTMLIISNNGSDTERTGDQTFVNGATYKADGSSTVTKTISAAGYATFCCNRAVDFSNTGLTAYIAKKDASNNVTFTAVTKVPAKTGVLLKGDEGSYTINSTWSDELDDVTDNVLVGVTADTKVAAGSFVLMSGADGVGFYKTTKDFTVGANTAYIEALPTAVRFISLDTEGEISTGIENLKKENNVLNNEYYNLSGQRVVKPTKGLYIVNGKKMVIK